MSKYKCEDCGDTVFEPKAENGWDCIICGGRMVDMLKNEEH